MRPAATEAAASRFFMSVLCGSTRWLLAAVALEVLSQVCLVVALALATFGAFTATGASWLTVSAGALLLATLGVLVVLARSPHRLRRPAIAVASLADKTWRRRWRGGRAAEARVDARLAKLGAVQLGWRDWSFVGGFALAAVAADCAVWLVASHAIIVLPSRCLRSGLTARVAQRCANFHRPSSAALLVAYSAGQAALAIPFLPGGVGLVESFMSATLTTAKVGAIQALSAVLLYRLISVWGVVLVGGLIWWLTSTGDAARRRARARQAEGLFSGLQRPGSGDR